LIALFPNAHGATTPFVLSRCVQYCTDTEPGECNDRHPLRKDLVPVGPMLFIVGLGIALVAVVVIPRMRMPGAAPLGSMSERWLAEHRASHPL
jgi:hypothetical protein